MLHPTALIEKIFSSQRPLSTGIQSQPNTNLGPTGNPPTTRAVTCLARVHSGSKCVLMCMSFSCLPMRVACASVYLRIGGIGRERFRPAKILRNRAKLQIYPLPLPRAGGRAEEPRLECCLDQNGYGGCINRAQSFNRWVIGVEATNTRRPITPQRTNKQTHTHQHQKRELKRGRGTRTRSVNTFVFRVG